MASPDAAAADYIPQWRDRSIPQPGDTITLCGLVGEPGAHFLRERHASGTVAKVSLWSPTRGVSSYSELIVNLVDDPHEYRLRDLSSQCNWTYTARSRPEPVALASEIDDTELAPPVAADSIVALERRLLVIHNRLTALAAEEKSLKAEKVRLNDQVLARMVEEQMETLPGVDGMTAFLAPVYFIEYEVDPETGERYTADDVAEALRESGYEGMLKEGYHGGQLRSLVREILVDNEKPLPEPLAKVLSLGNRLDVRFTPQSQRKRVARPQDRH